MARPHTGSRRPLTQGRPRPQKLRRRDPKDSSEGAPCLLPGSPRIYPLVLIRKPGRRRVKTTWDQEATGEPTSNHVPEYDRRRAADADHRSEELCDVRWLAEPDLRQAVHG